MRATIFVASVAACLGGSAGCGATPPEPRAAPITTPTSQPEQTSEPLPPRAAGDTAPESCADDHVWDATARACRLFPGGGYGWAGCSQAKAPPNDEACVSGTHWQECDCRCDAPSARWNPSAKRCE